MSNQIILELRERINNKHREALAALEKLAEYLEEVTPGPGRNGAEHASAPVSIIQKAVPQVFISHQGHKPARTIREKVLFAMEAGSETVAEISQETGLNKKQIRGVLNAPDLENKFTRSTDHGGVVHYSRRGRKVEAEDPLG